MTWKIIYLYSFKGLINRIKRHPLKIIAISAAVIFLAVCPAFLIDGEMRLEIPYHYIAVFFHIYFAYVLLEILLKKSIFSSVSQPFISLLSAVPEKGKMLYKVLVYDLTIKSCVSYSALYMIISLYNNKSIGNFFSELALLLPAIASLVFLSGIASFFSMINTKKIIKIIITFVIISLSFNGINVLLKGQISEKKQIFLYPPLLYADIAEGILHLKADIDYLSLFIRIILFFSFMLVLYFIMLKKIDFQASDMLKKIENRKNNARSKSVLEHIENIIPVLPTKIRLMIIREIMQILKEKYVLLNVFLQTFFAAMIMLISAITIEKNALYIGLIVAMGYVGFIISLYSFPRDTKAIGLFKTSGIKPGHFFIAKFITNYIVAFLIAAIVSIIYTLSSFIIISESLRNLIRIYCCGLLSILPLSVLIGMLVSSCMPYVLEEKKKRVTYKFNGLEGIFLTVIIFIGVVPSYIFMEQIQNIFIVASFILYLTVITIAAKAAMQHKYNKMN